MTNDQSTADLSNLFSTLMRRHRSIRCYKPDPLDSDLILRICREAIAGSSSSGNLQTHAIVLSEEQDRRDRLCELHGGQEMVRQAPLLMTFCADVSRIRRWFKLSAARDSFDNLLGFLVAAFDAIILSQSVALAAEANGLGICYLGTTLNAGPKIAEFLELPDGCLPVTALTIGYPAEEPAPRNRLPIEAHLHRERYQAPTDDRLLELYRTREESGMQRIRESVGPEEMAKHEIRSLAQFYTSEIKYSQRALDEISRKWDRLLTEGVFNGHRTR